MLSVIRFQELIKLKKKNILSRFFFTKFYHYTVLTNWQTIHVIETIEKVEIYVKCNLYRPGSGLGDITTEPKPLMTTGTLFNYCIFYFLLKSRVLSYMYLRTVLTRACQWTLGRTWQTLIWWRLGLLMVTCNCPVIG